MKRYWPTILGFAIAASSFGTAYAQVNSREGNALSFQINDVEYARISETAGNFGIGTTNPLAKLTVNGTVSITDALQISGTTLTCSTPLAGAIRYTSGTVQVCNGTSWGNIGIGVPTGTIMAFAASSCPSGWTEYTPARGRFLRGIDNGAGIDPDGTRSPGATQADAMQDHNHDLGYTSDRYSAGTGRSDIGFNNGDAWNAGYYTSGPQAFGVGGTPRVSSETRPKNVAVTYCQYAGYDSAIASGITNLDGLSDVTISAPSNGQVLTYSGGTWMNGAAPAATAASNTGAIQFNSGNALAGDTDNLFWDDATNRLGVGTTAPQSLLHVAGTNTTTHQSVIVENAATSGVAPASFVVSSSGVQSFFWNYGAAGYIGTGTAHAFTISTNNTGRMTFASAGNVGIGTSTPGAKLAVAGDISTTGEIYVADGTASVPAYNFTNDTNTGAYRPAADIVGISTGGTERMRITTSAVSASLPIYTSGSSGGFFAYDRTTGTGVGGLYRSGGDTFLYDSTAGNVLSFDSTGEISIAKQLILSRKGAAGTYNSAQVQGIWSIGDGYEIDTVANDFGTQYGMGYAYSTNGGAPFSSIHQITFVQAGTVNAAVGLDGKAYFAGNVGIGTTPSTKLNIDGNSAAHLVSLYNSNAAGDGIDIRVNAATPPNTVYYLLFRDSANGIIGSVRGNGSGGVTFNTTSDRRLKQDIVPTHLGLADLMRIQVRDYSPKNLPHTRLTGFIAQELNEIYPTAVTPPVDDGDDPTKKYWSVDYGRVTPLIVKALQDLKGLFDKHDKTIAELKAANNNAVSHTAALERENTKLRTELRAANDNLKTLERRLDTLEQKTH